MLTQGRLVPRQPWAIESTTPTALHYEGNHNVKHIHGNIGINSTALHRYHIRNGKYILLNIGTTLTTSVINKQIIGLY